LHREKSDDFSFRGPTFPYRFSKVVNAFLARASLLNLNIYDPAIDDRLPESSHVPQHVVDDNLRRLRGMLDLDDVLSVGVQLIYAANHLKILLI
jgi:hypothetical protein